MGFLRLYLTLYSPYSAEVTFESVKCKKNNSLALLPYKETRTTDEQALHSSILTPLTTRWDRPVKTWKDVSQKQESFLSKCSDKDIKATRGDIGTPNVWWLIFWSHCAWRDANYRITTSLVRIVLSHFDQVNLLVSNSITHTGFQATILPLHYKQYENKAVSSNTWKPETQYHIFNSRIYQGTRLAIHTKAQT